MEKVFEVPGQGRLVLASEEMGLSVTVEDFGRKEKGSILLRMKELGSLVKWMVGLEEAVSFKYRNTRIGFRWLPEKAGFRVVYEEFDEQGNRIKRAGIAPKGLIALKLLTLLERFIKEAEVVLTLKQKLLTKAKGMMIISDQVEGKQAVLSFTRMEELKYLVHSLGKLQEVEYDHKGIRYNGKLEVDGITFGEPEIRILKVLL